MDYETFKRRKREGSLPQPSQLNCCKVMTEADFAFYGLVVYGLLMMIGGR